MDASSSLSLVFRACRANSLNVSRCCWNSHWCSCGMSHVAQLPWWVSLSFLHDLVCQCVKIRLNALWFVNTKLWPTVSCLYPSHNSSSRMACDNLTELREYSTRNEKCDSSSFGIGSKFHACRLISTSLKSDVQCVPLGICSVCDRKSVILGINTNRFTLRYR